jgi:membrane-associated protease RseP (regulator of RpoE activity)
MRRTSISAAIAVIAASAFACPAWAGAAAPTPQDRSALVAQLANARADLDRSARRVVELSEQLGLRGGIRTEQLGGLKPVVGIVLAPDPRTGVLIAGVTPDSPAAAAGLAAGDRLTAIDGHPIVGASGDARIANARSLLDRMDVKSPVTLTVQRGARTLSLKATPTRMGPLPGYAFVDANGSVTEALGDVTLDGDAANPGISARAFYVPSPGVSPNIRREVVRAGPGKCEGDACRLPMLADAFRWHGLNLATVDAKLGRYFGTSSGVLVLSAGDGLAGLQPGDVLRSIDGKRVATPREAMAALQAHPPGSRIDVQYLRDRKPAATQVTAPKAFPWPLPPRPPMPPSPPLPPVPPPSAMDDGVPAPVDGPVLALAPRPPLASADPTDPAPAH